MIKVLRRIKRPDSWIEYSDVSFRSYPGDFEVAWMDPTTLTLHDKDTVIAADESPDHSVFEEDTLLNDLVAGLPDEPPVPRLRGRPRKAVK